jgi:hypothetical protein
VATLVIVTQEDLAAICLLYDRVVRAHVAVGTTVVTLAPDTGRVWVIRPKGEPPPHPEAADVLVVRRFRRSTVYPAFMFVPPGVPREDVERAAALRVHPNEMAHLPKPAAPEDLAALSERRVLVEALARTVAACWDHFTPPRDEPGFALDRDHPFEQLDLIEALVRRTLEFSDNPLERRRLLYALLRDDEPLYPELVDLLDGLARMVRE